MALMKPEIQEVLRASGLLAGEKKSKGEETFSGKLDAAGLDMETLAEELYNMAKNSGNEALRLKALEIGMKAHGVLKDSSKSEGGNVPSFTIVIQQDSFGPPKVSGVPDGINPILIPRQVLSNLSS